MPDKSDTDSDPDLKVEIDDDDKPFNWPKSVATCVQAVAAAFIIYCFTTCTARVYESENAKAADTRKDSPEATVPIEGR